MKQNKTCFEIREKNGSIIKEKHTFNFEIESMQFTAAAATTSRIDDFCNYSNMTKIFSTFFFKFRESLQLNSLPAAK